MDWLGLIQGGVKLVEDIFGHGNGPAKKQAAVAVIGDVANLATPVLGAVLPATMTSNLPSVIDDVVKLLNDLGVFTHGTPTAPK